LSSAAIRPLLKVGVAERNVTACEAPIAGMSRRPLGGRAALHHRSETGPAGIEYKHLILNKSFTPTSSLAVFMVAGLVAKERRP
jgi:hypothetical protein